MKRYSIGIIAILIVLSLSIFSVFAETGVVEFKYFFVRSVNQSINDIYFTDMRDTRITGHQIDLTQDLSTPQVKTAIYTNRSTGSYTISLTFSPLQVIENEMPDFWGKYKTTVYRYVGGELTAIGTLDVNTDSTTGKSISFTGDNSPSADDNVTFYYPISFDFADYIDDYPAKKLTGTIRVEVAT